MAKSKYRILILRLGGMGEVISITPALRALRKRFPDAEITLMCESRSADIISGLNYVDRFICADKFYRADNLCRLLSFETLRQAYTVCERILMQRFRLYISFNHIFFLRSIFRTLFFAAISRAPVRAGFDSNGLGFMYTHKIPDDRFKREHIVSRNTRLMARLGIPVDCEKTEIFNSHEDELRAQQILQTHGIQPNQRIFGIVPGSSRPATRWMADKFAAVVKTVSDKYGILPVFLGSTEEEEICRTVGQASGSKFVNLAGKTTVGEMVAIVRRLTILLSNDTGTLHIGYALNVPTVGIFRPGEHWIWGTYPDKSRFRGLSKDVPCAPCYLYQCGHHTCMKLLEPVEVVNAICELLDRSVK